MDVFLRRVHFFAEQTNPLRQDLAVQGPIHSRLISVQKGNCLNQLFFWDKEDAVLVAHTTIQSLMTYHFKGLRAPNKGPAEELHNRLDTKSLKGYEQIPAVNSWLDHTSTAMAGYNFQEAMRFTNFASGEHRTVTFTVSHQLVKSPCVGFQFSKTSMERNCQPKVANIC